jgi:hypothetical protein
VQPRADHGEQSYRGHGRLVGKTALITGGDSGIGRAVAIAFAREGANVVISYLPEEEADAQESKRWVEEAGQKSFTVPGDIRDENHCRKMVESIFAEQGRLDILVNNAAYQMTYNSLAEISAEEIDRTFDGDEVMLQQRPVIPDQQHADDERQPGGDGGDQANGQTPLARNGHQQQAGGEWDHHQQRQGVMIRQKMR